MNEELSKEELEELKRQMIYETPRYDDKQIFVPFDMPFPKVGEKYEFITNSGSGELSGEIYNIKSVEWEYENGIIKGALVEVFLRYYITKVSNKAKLTLVK